MNPSKTIPPIRGRLWRHHLETQAFGGTCYKVYDEYSLLSYKLGGILQVYIEYAETISNWARDSATHQRAIVLGSWCHGTPLTSQDWDVTQARRKEHQRLGMPGSITVREPSLLQTFLLVLRLQTAFISTQPFSNTEFQTHHLVGIELPMSLFMGQGIGCWLGKEDTPQCQLFAQILSHFFFLSLSLFYPLGWKLADNNLVSCHVPV